MPKSQAPAAGGPPTETGRPIHSPQRRWVVLVVVAGSLFLAGIDLTVLHVAMPSVSRDLQPSAAQVLWIVDVYSLALAAMLVTCGTLGDRIGRRRMVLSGLLAFGLSSLACAFAANTAQLIAARAALGVSSAMIMASTVAIIRVTFTDNRERALAIGVWTSAHSVGATLGPLIGGLVSERWGWGAVFLVNVPVVAVLLAVGARVIPESKNPVPRRWDVLSVVLSVVGLAGVVYALKQAGEHAGINAVFLVSALVGTVLLYVFVRRQRTLAEPLLDFSLFSERRFSTATVCVIGCFGSYVALLFFLTQWLQQVGGYEPLQAGLALMPLAAANAVGAVAAPWLAGRWGNRAMLTAALLLFALAYAVIATVGDPGRYGTLLAALLAAGFGAGIVMTLGADVIMSAAQPERSGEAAAIQETSFELGAGLGVAVFGSVMTLVYGSVIPTVPGLGPDQQETVKESFTAAQELMAHLPSTTADAVLEAARHAYDRGFTTVATIATAGLVGTATLAAVMLRPRKGDAV
ncbi:MFS transporter [Streptomyces sp. NPDC017979]|uniref:MFS transporter n=1 Tax=Streptomyces sp. NPDC017979 TaxID=3365024 RepID=UPI0037B9BE27